MSDNLLLDTCALIWLATGSRKLSADAKKRINAAPQVFVSAITAWEISLKSERGDLTLPEEMEQWFPKVLLQHDLVLADLTPEILIAANRLPWHHRDPADRFILATAQLRRLTIVTGDKRFKAYAIPVVG
ncbi:type II toxin-antitoxin system VapC family toxin [Haloferula sp. A504]|jgi:PIN domain nuclease of toxin-antitoxin system|uniref:type II toxin-antitoxin system VapC family toxin n=1 Tax=Haloferula sp. A504 TaxID=3373601 RepID=UPI0031C69E02|nr:type II toxin-antitoxin system VapC family toxin [Verrucomicrobiaceae bacterium E54]